MIGMGESRPNFKLNPTDAFISVSLLNNIISETTVKKAVVEENISELWYETLHGYGKITFKNNITYEGSLKYGILNNEDPDNPCTLCFPDGTKYVGTIKNNRITGSGTYTFNNGSTYSGSVLNGLRHGYGIYKSSKNIFYEGGWKNGLKDGKGKIIQGGMELEGEWKEGILCGKCRIKWKTGNIFEGELNNNAMNGNGYMIWFNKNEKFVGEWKNNLQYADMKGITRSKLTPHCDSAAVIYREAAGLLSQVERRPVRLIGVGIYNISGEAGRQMTIEDIMTEFRERNEEEKRRMLDALGSRYGLDFAGNLDKLYRADTLHRTVEYMRKHAKA